MDQMVPALLDLTEKQLFSPAEISMLVNKRRGFEYLLQRVHARQSDFLLYIEFELNLLKLYNLRLAKTPKTKPSASDYHIEQHIHLIFVRAMRKYKSDIAMWLQYIDFCKKNNSSKKLGQIFAQALTYHPHNTTLYIESAGWEFFEQGNAKNARVVLQRALRTCNDAQELWLQYFIMELHYIQKMRGRREILQLKGKMGKKMEESEAFSGQVPLLVFQGAIKAVPQDVAFRLKVRRASDAVNERVRAKGDTGEKRPGPNVRVKATGSKRPGQTTGSKRPGRNDRPNPTALFTPPPPFVTL